MGEVNCAECGRLFMGLMDKGLCQTCWNEKVRKIGHGNREFCKNCAFPLVDSKYEGHCITCWSKLPKNKLEDSVNHPPHYNQGKIEVIEFIEDKKLNFNRGNAVKYISRAGIKNVSTEVEDLKKAIWYLRREIALLQGNACRPNDMPKEETN